MFPVLAINFMATRACGVASDKNKNKKKLLIVDVTMPDLPRDKFKRSCDICFFGGGVEALNARTLECNVAR